MSGLRTENFEAYGGSLDRMLEGRIVDVGDGGIGVPQTTLVIPSFETNNRHWLSLAGRAAGIRNNLGGSFTEIGGFVEFYTPTLPQTNNRMFPLEFRNSSNETILKLRVTTDGNLQVANDDGTVVAATTTPCIVAGTAHRLQVQAVFHGSTGIVEVRLDGNTTPVIDAENLDLPGTATQFFIGNNTTPNPTAHSWFCKAYAIYSLEGVYNDDWPSIDGVALQWIDGDTDVDDLTPRPRQMIEAGILRVPGSGSVLDCASSAAYDLTHEDFTIETFARFATLPSGTQERTLLGKWSRSTSQRSYRLVKYGPDSNDGRLKFQYTTNGAEATLTDLIDVEWEPEIGRRYHLAVVREDGEARLYIDGRLYGVPVADATAFFSATAKFTVGGEMSGTGTTVLANSSTNGMFDEVRITNGVARYDANFTPPTEPFPRTLAGDPDFASVVLLLGFDESIVDESGTPKTVTARGSAARQTPADADAAYKSALLFDGSVIDDRFLEAALLPATGILTLSEIPLDTETVTLGAKTYTFVDTLGAANTVLIGATIEDCVSNLVAAINEGAGEGTVYGTGTEANEDALAAVGPSDTQLTATAILPGAAGNSITSTETLTEGAWSDTTLGGGADIPGPSEFLIQRLDPRITGVRWVEIVDRSWVSTGEGAREVTFVSEGDASPATEVSVTTSPTYRRVIVEEDPATEAGLTPTAINNGRIRIERVTPS